MKRKTKEEFLAELNLRNPNVELHGEYTNVSTHTVFYCLEHKKEWITRPYIVLNGSGCELCHSKRLSEKKKMSKDEYISRLANANPTVELVGKFDDSTTRTNFHCLTHDVYWNASPREPLTGHGCPKCHAERLGNTKRMRKDEFVARLKTQNPTVELEGDFTGCFKKARFHCKIHPNEYWEVNANTALTHIGCSKCKHEKLSNVSSKTTEEYKNELSVIHPNIYVLDEYQKSITPILHYCNKHNVKWSVAPYTLLHGVGCPECVKDNIKNRFMLTHDEYVKLLKEKNPDVIPQESYLGYDVKIKHLHKSCKHITLMTPDSALQGNGCNLCVGKKISKKIIKSHEQYINDLGKINPYIKIHGKYKGYDQRIYAECVICGNQWEPCAGFLTDGQGCPVCNESIGERNIRRYLDAHNIEFVRSYKFDDLLGIGNGKLSYDFFIPLANLLVEFQGEQHKKPIEHFGGEKQFKIQQEHDKRKMNYALTHGYNFLEIFSKDIHNIDNILDEYLNSIKSETVTTAGVAQ